MSLAHEVADHVSVYRCFDRASRLLYVGASSLGLIRFHQHHTEKAWWPGVARIEVEHYGSRAEALAVERTAIETEEPAMNVVYGKRRSTTVRSRWERAADRERGVPPEHAKALHLLRRRQHAIARARRDAVLAAWEAGVSLGKIADLAGLYRVDAERVIWYAQHSEDGRAALSYR